MKAPGAAFHENARVRDPARQRQRGGGVRHVERRRAGAKPLEIPDLGRRRPRVAERGAVERERPRRAVRADAAGADSQVLYSRKVRPRLELERRDARLPREAPERRRGDDRRRAGRGGEDDVLRRERERMRQSMTCPRTSIPPP